MEMSFVGKDRKNVIEAVNQGIDSRLEGFTRSKFSDNGHRLNSEVHPEELQILIRRLTESGDDDAQFLADDIVTAAYEIEPRD